MLLSKTAKIKWNSRNYRHYINLGYEYTGMGTEFEVKVDDLTNGSAARVKAKCEYCGRVYDVEWKSYLCLKKKSNNKDCCGDAACTGTKAQETITAKYGTNTVLKIKSVRDQIAATNLEKYGVENPFANKQIQEKIRETSRTNYGHDYPMQNVELRERVKKTNLEKYGVEHYVELLKGKFIGEKSPVWKGDKVKNPRSERDSVKNREWRKAVFSRDVYTCQCCGARNGNGHYVRLEAHHMYNWTDHPDLRYKLDNGITFCEKCHISFHRIYGKKNNNERQVDEFIQMMNKMDKKIC